MDTREGISPGGAWAFLPHLCWVTLGWGLFCNVSGRPQFFFDQGSSLLMGLLYFGAWRLADTPRLISRAVWKAHAQKCAYCDRFFDDPSLQTIDHVIPSKGLDLMERNRILKELIEVAKGDLFYPEFLKA